METVLIKVLTEYGTLLASSPGVKLKENVLCYAGPLATLPNIIDNGSPVPVEVFQKYKYEMVSSSVPRSMVDFEFTKIHCVATYNCDFIRETLDHDLQDICFGSESNTDRLPSKNFSLILMFSLNRKCENLTEILYEFFDYLSPLNRKMIGNAVIIYSTPFRNLFLFNSQSNGIVCNLFGRNDCLFLTDAKLSSGCEGSPVYSLHGELFGTVANVFTWCKGEWMGFTLAVHFHPVLKAWLNIEEKKSVTRLRDISVLRNSFVEEVDSLGVVLISSSTGVWGSGIVFDINSGLILTCSHVVSFSTDTNILVEYKRKKYYNAKILYASVENSPYDLAVIEVPPSNFKECIEFKAPLTHSNRGEQVYTVAYPLFSFKNQTIQGPSVTYGHIAKVYSRTMIIAACASNSGSSGGALIKKTGELVGIISNNLRVQDLLIPHMTIVIPTSVFVGPLKDYISTKDVNHLNRLTVNDEYARRVWRLENKSKL